MFSQKKISYFVSFLVFYLLSVSSPGLAQADTWKTKADMPTPRMDLTTCVVAGKIYAIGGYQKANAPGLTTVEVYDPATDT